MLTSLAFLSALNLLAVTSPPTPKCVLRAKHGTPLLYGDVKTQTIVLTGNGWCSGLPNTMLLINGTDSNNRLYVKVDDKTPLEGTQKKKKKKKAKAKAKRQGELLEITTLSQRGTTPGATQSLSTSWNLFSDDSAAISGDKAVAQLLITSLRVQVSATTSVVYNEQPLLTELAAANAKPSNVAFACVSANQCPTHIQNVSFLGLPNVGDVAGWKITKNDDNLIIKTADAVDNAPTGTDRAPPSARITSQRVIEYTVKQPSANPLMATLKATRPSSGESFSLRVKLADSARTSSLPLNIADVVHVYCQKDIRMSVPVIIKHNDLAAVSNSVVSNNLCQIVISEDAISWAIAQRHGIDATRERCTTKGTTTEDTTTEDTKKIEARCKAVGARDGEFVTLLTGENEKSVNALKNLKNLYGQQRLTIFVYSDESKREASRQSIFVSANLKGRKQISINFGDEKPDPNKPFHVEVADQPVSSEGPLSELKDYPERTYRATLRPKGPFGITHRRGSLGSRSVRVFVTIPVEFASVRFPAAGLDLKSSSDTTAAQITSLTTGLLLTVEPWDYRRSTHRYAIPFRLQGGLLMSNWYKGVFHPSTYLGAAVTLPLVRGTTQIDTDLALGLGWEVDLRNGYDAFGPRSHLLLTLGMNILSLFGSQSAPK